MLHIATSEEFPYDNLSVIEGIDEDAREFLKLCLLKNWKDRPSAGELLKH